MAAIMFMNMHTVPRGVLDAFVSARMRPTAAAAEHARPRTPSRR